MPEKNQTLEEISKQNEVSNKKQDETNKILKNNLDALTEMKKDYKESTKVEKEKFTNERVLGRRMDKAVTSILSRDAEMRNIIKDGSASREKMVSSITNLVHSNIQENKKLKSIFGDMGFDEIKGIAEEIDFDLIAEKSSHAVFRGVINPLENAFEKFEMKVGNTVPRQVGARLVAGSRHILQAGQTLVQEVAGHVTEVLGPLHSMIIQPLMGLGKSLFGFVGSMLKGPDEIEIDIMRKQLQLAEEQNVLTSALVTHFKEEDKEDDRKMGEKKEFPWLTVLGAAVFALGAAIGAFVGKIKIGVKVLGTIFNPFINLAKAIKSSALFQPLIKLFDTIDVKVTTVLDKIYQFFNKFKLFGKLVKGFSFGLKKLALPLVILFSAVDFFKGFFGTEGTFMKKLKGGTMEMIEGLIELPVKIGGWLVDKILGVFGIEIEGGAGNAMLNSIMEMVSMVWDGWGYIFKAIGGLISSIWSTTDLIKEFFNTVKYGTLKLLDTFKEKSEVIKESFDTIKDNISILMNDAIDMLLAPFRAIGDGIQKMKDVGASGWKKIKGWFNFGDEAGGPDMIDETGGPMVDPIVKRAFSLKNLDLPIDSPVGIRTVLSEPTYTTPMTQETEMGETGKGWIYPLDRRRLTSPFGKRIHPTTGASRMHKGIDMAGPEPGMYGYPVRAAKTGLVTIARPLRGYGNAIYMEHEGGWETRYGHLNSIRVKEGMQIPAGEIIGGMGNTGVGTGPHLHFETRKDDKAYNPLQVLSAQDGGFIKNLFETEAVPAVVHSNEAILPLSNDDIMNRLGENIGKYVQLSDESLKYLAGLQNKTITVLEELLKYMESGQTSTSELSQVINNIVSSGQQNINTEPPENIQELTLQALNSTWGLT